MSIHTQKDPTPEDEARPEIYDERLAEAGPQGIDTDPQVVSARGVTAIVVTHGRRRFLDRTLAALAEQVTLPSRVVLVDAGAETTEVPAAVFGVFDSSPVDVDLVTVRATGVNTFGAGVQAAVEHLEKIDPAADNSLRWLWLLHDDSAPEPDALLELLRAVEHNASVAIAGAKQRDWFAPARLLEVGLTTSPAGRRMTGIEAGEVDQGQHDGREDVLGVGLAGAIFRADVWNDLGGTDPEYGLFGDGLEISRRARLAGFRVIVAPSAVVLHAQGALNPRAGRHTTASAGSSATEPIPMSVAAAWGATRRSTLFYRLVGASPWTLPLHVLAMVLFIPLRMLWQLAAKQTGRVRHELTTVAWAAFRPLALRRSRVRFRTTTALPRRTLIPLRASWRDVLAERLHVRLARAELRRTLVTPDPLDRAERRRTRVRGAGNLGLVALGLAGLSVWWFGGVSGLLGSGGRLISPSLPLAEGSGPSLWLTITNGWNSSGFGSPTSADPLWTALTPLTFLSPSGLQTLVHALIIGSLLIGGVGAWFASGVGTRSLALRAWVAFAWIALPTAALAVSEGRLGTLLAHIALPWVVLGTLRGVGMTRPAPTEQASANEDDSPKKNTDSAQVGASLRRQPGSIPAAAGAGLALALAVGGAPALLVPVALILVLLALTIRRRSPRAGNRRYLWLVLLPSLLIVLPLVREVSRLGVDRFWPILLGAPGPAVPGVPAEGWVQLLGWPIAPPTWSTADGVLGHVLNATPFALGGLILLVAVGALLSGGAAGVPVRVAWLAATFALASAFAVGLVLVGQGAEVVHGWSGPFVSLAYVGFLAAFVLGLDAASGWTAGHSFGWRQTGLVLVSILALVVVGGTIAQTIRTNDLITPDRAGLQVLAEPVVPAVGQQMQDPPRQSRVLALGAGPETTFQVLRTDGPQAVDASAVLAGRALLDPVVESLPDGASSTPAEGDASVNEPDEILAHVVAQLVGGVDAGPGAMIELGIGSILLTPQGSEEDQIRISNRLDTLSSLERIAESESGIIWRVAVTSEPDEDDASRAASGETPKDASGGTTSQDSDQADPVTGTLEAQAAWARSVPETEDATKRSPAALGSAVPSSDLGIRTTIDPSPEMRHLVLAERADAGWQATLNGKQLRTLDVDWRQTFELGYAGGDLHVWYEMPGTSGWRFALIAVGVIYLLLVIPVRRRTVTR